ncbi:MAG: DoxX family membrane protein [Bacteroidota bacterium]
MSEVKGNYTKPQFYILLLLRLIIGYHFLFEGVNKLFNPSWSAVGFLLQSNWIFSDLFILIANSPTLLAISDFLNIWGQILIGLALIIGLVSRYAAIGGAVLLLLYYVAYPPFIEGYTFVDRNLLEFLGLIIVMLFQTSYIIGVDGLLGKVRSEKNG